MDKIINELIFIYKKFISRQYEPFIRPDDEGNKSEKLFFKFLNSEKTDFEQEDWEAKTEAERKAAMMLRFEIIEKLSMYAFVVNPKFFSRSNFVIALVSMLKMATSARILMALGLNKSGVYLAKKSTATAISLESWDVVLSLSTILSQFYSLRGNEEKVLEYNDLADFSIEMIRAAREMRMLLSKWTLLFGRKRKADAKVIETLFLDMGQADEISRKYDSPTLLHYNYRIKLFYYDAVMDYETTIQVCEEARANLVKSQKVVDQNKLGIYHGTQMYSYLNLKRFEEATVLAEQVEEYFNPGTLNWFIVMEYYFVLSVQTENYLHAYELYKKVIISKDYKELKGPRKQVWRLLEGYMQFIINSGIWKNRPPYIDEEQFRTTKFMNDVVSLSWDKTGIQVSILILQVLFLLQQSNYGAIIEKKDALKRYIYRYLYSKDNERSRVFLTFLSKVVEMDFVYSEVELRTKRLRTVLRALEMNYLANLGGNEILDYELLWTWVLDTLKKNWSRTAV